VNPTNPNNVVAGANDYRVCCDFDGLNDGTGWAYYSLDGGATWNNVQVPELTAETGASGNLKNVDAAGDPSIAFSPDGVAYYANLVFSRDRPVSGIVVSSSIDGGVTWSEPNVVAYISTANYLIDKDWIGAGPNGKVVVAWTRYSLGPHGASYLASPIVGAISSNYGHSWNRQGFPISDAMHPFDQGAQVAFDADGALYVAYEGAAPATGYQTDVQVIARSLDDGLTFETKELARVYDDFDCYPFYAGRQTLTDMHFRLNSFPSMSVDPATGKIAVVWADNQGAGSCGGSGTSFTGTTSNQVKLQTGTWSTIASAPVVPVTTSGPDKVFPAVAMLGGKTVVSYYTRDYGISSTAAVCNKVTNPAAGGIVPVPSPRSVCLDYAARVATGNSWGNQLRLSTGSSNPFIQFADGSFIGDYSQVAIGTDGKAHPAWTDFRGRPGVTSANQDVMTQTIP
jgi:ribosomal protein L31